MKDKGRRVLISGGIGSIVALFLIFILEIFSSYLDFEGVFNIVGFPWYLMGDFLNSFFPLTIIINGFIIGFIIGLFTIKDSVKLKSKRKKR